MKRLSFLKSLFCLASGYTVTKVVEPNLAKKIDKDRFCIDMRLTDQILIDNPDGTTDLNMYGNLCKIIARVVIRNEKQSNQKIIHFESEVTTKEQVEEYHWVKFEQSIRDYLSKNPDCGKSVVEFPPKVSLKIGVC